MTDPSIFAMVCEQRDALARELASYRELPLVPRADYDRACSDRDRYARAMDGLAAQYASASDGRAATQLAIGIRAVLEYVRLHSRVAYAPDERPVVDAVKAWLVENGARVYGDEAVYAAAAEHGTAVRR